MTLPSNSATLTPINWPPSSGGVPLDPAIESRIDELLASMTLEDMVGQTIQADIASITPDEMRQYRLGSVLNGGNSAPGNNVRASAAEWLALADEFYRASINTTQDIDTLKNRGIRKSAIPLLWGTDAVHGHNNVIGATIFPHNIGLGAARNPDLLRQIGTITAREVAATGIDWTFAPMLAVVQDDRWGRTYESYSENPEIVADYAVAIVQGLQGELDSDDFLGNDRVLATAKHFIGDGGTVNGKDRGDNVDREAELCDLHGAGYPPAIAAGVQTVMASFSSWQGQPLHGHTGLLTEVLKQRMGFNGFVVGDWDGHATVPGCTPSSCPSAMNAGIDMFMAPASWRKLYNNTIVQVKSGQIPRDRLEDAVRRILRVKYRLGLFEKIAPSQRVSSSNLKVLGAPEHLAVARQAVRESLVLIKNQGNLLPLATNQRVLVTGDGANDIGKQCGGWTLSWQGTGNSNADFPNGISIWEGLRAAIEAGGGNAILSVDGSYKQLPDVAIVVFGEEPYAEFKGDVEHLDFKSEQELTLLRSYRAAGIPTVAVFLSGRPLWVNPELNAADAFVAAWLPGTQGAGIADVLVRLPDGSVNYDFKGKLSFSWPRSAVQTPLNRGDSVYNPQFPYGYGLTYDDTGDLAQLSEVSGLEDSSLENSSKSVVFAYGDPVEPWRVEGRAAGIAIREIASRTQFGNSLIVRPVDRLAQEDARQFVWSGEGIASVAIAASSPDVSQEFREDMAIAIQFRIDTAPLGPVKLFVDSGETCHFELDVSPWLSEVSLGEWTETTFNLGCLDREGKPIVAISALGLETSQEFVISIADIRFVPSSEPTTCF